MKQEYIVGKRTRIHKPNNLYGCIIGDDCVIAAFTEIQRNVIIGNKCKIEAYVFIPTGVHIKDRVFIGPHVCFTNDKYPTACTPKGELKTIDDWTCEATIVNEDVAIGANSTILPGIVIGKQAIISAGAIITKDVPPYKKIIGKW